MRGTLYKLLLCNANNSQVMLLIAHYRSSLMKEYCQLVSLEQLIYFLKEVRLTFYKRMRENIIQIRHSNSNIYARECGAFITSCGQNDARGIVNFKHGHCKQQKIQAIVGTTKSGVYERRFLNRQQPHATMESAKKKIQTEKDKLGNHHDHPDHTVNERIWYKYVWGKLKKQAKKIADSKADADSSSDESISDSDEKQTMFQKSQKKTSDFYGTRRPSDSTGKNLKKLFVSNKTSAFRSSEGVEVNHVSQKRVKNKTEPSFQARMILESNCVYNNPLLPAVPPYASIPNQAEEIPEDASEKVCHGDDVHGNAERNHTVNEIWYKYIWRVLKIQAKKIADSKADADSSSDESISDSDAKQTMLQKSQKKSINTHATKRPSGNKLEKHFVSEYYLKFDSSEGVKILSWDKVSYSKILPTSFALSPLNSTEQ
ncbi:hypothetical protein ACJMK2_029116, partial [Sinanodonta woodiana]